MPLKTATLDEPSLNLTPMIDIVFLLIIFFMVGTQFSELEEQFQVKLPTSGKVTPLSRRPDELVVSVARDGRIVLNGDLKTIPELESELVAARENYPDQGVVIRGEGDGRYQAVIDVLAAVNRAEIRAVSLAYRAQSDE